MNVTTQIPDGTLPDGLTALREVLQPDQIMRLIEKTARWVDPETFRLLPVWYPEHARGKRFYKANWSEPQHNRNQRTGESVHKQEGNNYANKALTHALGLRSRNRKNWSCCHIWGVDDPLFQQANQVVQDRRFYSCVANMVLLPTPMKAFTDAMTEVKDMLRICAANLYGWTCDHAALEEARARIAAWTDWAAYPESWPRTPGEKTPLGMIPINAAIRADARKRLAAIERDLAGAGEEYPHDQVREVLAAWEIQFRGCVTGPSPAPIPIPPNAG